MGKTAFCINIAQNILMNSKMSIIFFSMEMSNEQVIMRILSSLLEIKYSKIRNKNLNEKELFKLNNIKKKIKESNFYINDKSNLNYNDIRNTCKKFKIKNINFDIIMIDYIQLMSGNNNYYENRALEISDISKNLKNLAREFNCSVVVLSQLNRALETRSNKRPIMSDLKESGSIEQDADLILFLYRENVYNYKFNSNITEIIIGKHRNGPIGTIKLNFIGKYMKYENI
uniref:SF4 helicase domain-containing protein n=1 Tax=Clastoptera arizonana TaxID=38151 RepID=A0A1B6DIE8_9HEMI